MDTPLHRTRASSSHQRPVFCCTQLQNPPLVTNALVRLPSRTVLCKNSILSARPSNPPFPVPASTETLLFQFPNTSSQSPISSHKPVEPTVYTRCLPLQSHPFACGLSPRAPRHWERRRKPRPCRLLGASSRKSRLLCSRCRRRRCRCCCGWCSEVRGSESRLSPFHAVAMKWMFKEDHSLGERRATGRAMGAGAAGGPLPHLGRSGLGRAGRIPLFGLVSPRLQSPDRLPTDPVRPPGGLPGSQETKDRDSRDSRMRAQGVRRSRGGGGKRAREPVGGRAPLSSRCVSPTEHRCVESAKIRAKYPDRVPVSGLHAPSPHCHLCLLVLKRGPRSFNS